MILTNGPEPLSSPGPLDVGLAHVMPDRFLLT